MVIIISDEGASIGKKIPQTVPLIILKYVQRSFNFSIWRWNSSFSVPSGAKTLCLMETFSLICFPCVSVPNLCRKRFDANFSHPGSFPRTFCCRRYTSTTKRWKFIVPEQRYHCRHVCLLIQRLAEATPAQVDSGGRKLGKSSSMPQYPGFKSSVQDHKITFLKIRILQDPSF